MIRFKDTPKDTLEDALEDDLEDVLEDVVFPWENLGRRKIIKRKNPESFSSFELTSSRVFPRENHVFQDVFQGLPGSSRTSPTIELRFPMYMEHISSSETYY